MRFALLAFVAACGGASQHPDAAPTPPDLTGAWKSPCVAAPQADGSTLYATLALTVPAAGQWALDYTLHADAACGQPLVTVAIHGPYQLLEPSPTVAGAWDARFAFDDKTITPHAQPIADALTAAHCGTGTWTLEQAQSVYAAGCAAFGQYPQASCAQDYDLLAVDGGALRFGQRPADNNLCTPDRRPTQLASVALAKQ